MPMGLPGMAGLGLVPVLCHGDLHGLARPLACCSSCACGIALRTLEMHHSF